MRIRGERRKHDIPYGFFDPSPLIDRARREHPGWRIQGYYGDNGISYIIDCTIEEDEGRENRMDWRNGEPFEFERLSEREAREYQSLWATARAAFPEMPDYKIALIVSLAADTCQSCHADNGDCQCWNDE